MSIIHNFIKLQNNIENCFSRIKDIYKADLIEKNSTTPGIKFCIYGTDIAPDNTLNVKLIECNKGPSLSKFDDRDGALKYEMVRDAFAVVDIINDNTKSNFILIK